MVARNHVGCRRSSRALAVLLIAVFGWGLISETTATAGPPTGYRVMPAGGTRAEAVALIFSGQQGGAISFEALAFPLPALGSEFRVPLLVEIDGSSLLAGHQADFVHAEIYVYALDDKSSVKAALMKVIEADLSLTGDTIRASGIKYQDEISLSPGGYQLRVLVRNAQTGAVGARTLPLEVPNLRQNEGAIAPLLWREPDDRWLKVGSGEEPLIEGVAAFPVLPGDAAFEAEALFLNLPAETTASIEILTQDGQKIDEFSLKTRRNYTGMARELQRRVVSVRPLDLAPGIYLVRVNARSEGGIASSSSIPVLIAERKEESPRVWAELVGEAAAAATAPTVASSDVKLKLPESEIVEAVDDALILLSDGRWRAAMLRLTETEAEALGGSGNAVERLEKIESQAIRRIARHDPEVLLPVIVLYERLYRGRRERHHFLLSTHARRMIFSLTDLYVKESRARDASTTIAGILSTTAAELQLAGLGTFSIKMFRRALELDPDNEIAMLCFASGFERRGAYSEAVYQLEQMLERHPGHPEARLRLAVNSRRLAQSNDAKQLLAQLIAQTPPDWVLSIAYQESISIHLEHGALNDASTTAREALERLPGDEKLQLLLARSLDRDRNRAGSRAILETLIPHADTQSSPRHRYGQLPFDRLRAERQRLQELVAERLPKLASIVNPRTPADSSR